MAIAAVRTDTVRTAAGIMPAPSPVLGDPSLDVLELLELLELLLEELLLELLLSELLAELLEELLEELLSLADALSLSLTDSDSLSY